VYTFHFENRQPKEGLVDLFQAPTIQSPMMQNSIPDLDLEIENDTSNNWHLFYT
jgi:hypothetical protein